MEVRLHSAVNRGKSINVTPTDVEFVRLYASKLIEKSGIRRPPIPLEPIAQSCGIKKIIKVNLGTIDALLAPDKDGFVVKLNPLRSKERQRFSLAHEIAHTFFLDRDKTDSEKARGMGIKQRQSFEETLCNMGASELLMPYEMFRKHASRYDFSIYGLVPLSRLFYTSLKATALRLTQVSPRRCVVVRWVVDKQPELVDFAFRVDWATRLNSKVSATGGPFVKYRWGMSANSGIGEAYRSDYITVSHQYLDLRDYKGRCYVESQGFNSYQGRYVISLIVPESEECHGYQ